MRQEARDWYPPAAPQPCTKRTDHHLGRRTARGLLKSQVAGKGRSLHCALTHHRAAPRGDGQIAVWTPQWATHSSGPTYRAWSKTRDALCCPHAPSFLQGPRPPSVPASSRAETWTCPGFLRPPWNPSPGPLTRPEPSGSRTDSLFLGQPPPPSWASRRHGPARSGAPGSHPSLSLILTASCSVDAAPLTVFL